MSVCLRIARPFTARRTVCSSKLLRLSCCISSSLPRRDDPEPSKSTDSIKPYLAPVSYHQFQKDRMLCLQKCLEGPNRYVRISEREDRSDIPVETYKAHSTGKYITFHRGMDVMKCPEDIVIYSQLLWHIKPATVIEIGACSGGAAIWMSDMLKLIGTTTQIFSMDIDLSLLEERVKELKPPNVTFIQGDSQKIEVAFPAEFLQKLPHPWVVIEDAHINFTNVLKHFHRFMQAGDYFVMDDTSPHCPTTSGMGRIYPEYVEWGPIKLNALRKFLSEHDDYYAVDTFFTDYFGYNGTWNWHGYVKRMR